MFSLGITPQQLFSLHRGSFRSGTGNLSPELWCHALGNALPADGQNSGVLMGDDFSNFVGLTPAISGTTALPSATVPSSGYGLYMDTATSACSINPKSTAINTCRIATGATDNHEAWMQSNGGIGGNCKFDDTILAFEAVFSVAQIAANTGAAFVGLGQPGMAAANAKVDDTGVIVASKSLIGFDTVQAAPQTANFVFQDASGSLVTHIAGVKTLVADTLVNLGFIYDPGAKASQRLKIFVDNVEQSTYVTGSVLEGATFPYQDILSFVVGIKNGSAAAAYLDIKGWQLFYQY